MIGSALNVLASTTIAAGAAFAGAVPSPGKWLGAKLDRFCAPATDSMGWSTIPVDANRNYFYTKRVQRALAQRSTAYNAFKWSFDKAFAASALIATAPLLAASGAAIRLTAGGPILFVQERIGKDSMPFDVYKLRTMHVGSEELGTYTASEGDPRVTRVGKFLRRYRFDELPQFINVLIGDMSMIGPRPDALDMVRMKVEANDGFNARHLAKPGITGWAQVREVYVNEDMTRLELQVHDDIFGITNASVLLDLEVVLRTAWTIFAGRGN
ncbi:MAG: sugar transferase [Deltaproteobacteria bacterium]|nr:sugar transferase [Deltaproteobacteria bacterium]